MTPAIRLAVLLLVLLLAHGTVSAQPAVAPEPHLSLPELVKEYRQCGLPVPPPDAEPVRVKWDSDHKPYFLAFRCPPTKPGEHTRYLEGTTWWPSELRQAPITPELVTPVGPPSEALRGVRAWGNDFLSVAIQCEIRGWNELARVVYAEARKELLESAKQTKFPSDPLRVMRDTAWYYWESKLMELRSDRKEIWTRLSYLAGVEPAFLTKKNRYTLKDLEATVTPRKSKPGSVEELIDGLTEYNSFWIEDEANNQAYWKLMELGFDAVPTLIEHLEDWRLTRYQTGQINNFQPYLLRIADVITTLLNDLADGEFVRDQAIWANGGTLHPGDALKWWGKARQIGEERWLIDHALPTANEDREHLPNQVIIRALQAKYPRRLKDLYQTTLKRPETRSEVLTKAIAASKLPLKDKIAALEEGIASKEHAHQHYALEALAEVDPAGFRRHLLRFIEGLPPELRINSEYNNELTVLSSIRKTGDPKCWAALAAATHRVSPKTRLQFIRVAGWPPYPGEPDPGRRECLRFLLRFLNTDSISEDARDCRDLATWQVAKHFALIDWRLAPGELPSWRSPREISLLRDRVRELAERELARPEK